MARSRGFQFRIMTRSQKRKTSWALGPTTDGVQAVTATSKVAWTFASVALSDGLTIVRTRGEFLAFLTAASGAAEGFQGALGIAKFTDQAVAIGPTALPGPLTDVDWDGWLYHRLLSVYSGDAIVAAGAANEAGQGGQSGVRIEIDSKAMRKVNTNEFLVAVMEFTLEGTATLRTVGEVRFLVKLP